MVYSIVLSALMLSFAANHIVGKYVCVRRGEPHGGQIRDIGFDYIPDMTKYEFFLHDVTVILPTIALVVNRDSVDFFKVF